MGDDWVPQDEDFDQIKSVRRNRRHIAMRVSEYWLQDTQSPRKDVYGQAGGSLLTCGTAQCRTTSPEIRWTTSSCHS